MSYRPICDRWLLARPKVPYYGAYPAGFLERARVFLPVLRTESVLHVCGGRAKDYPNWMKLCPYDQTLDLRAEVKPDYLQNAMEPLPSSPFVGGTVGWRGILCDPPYTDEDADKYQPNGRIVRPPVTALLRHCLQYVEVGGRVGMLHYMMPRPPKVGVKLIASIPVVVGYENRERCYSVFERTA